ncbi:MAG: hypothetical protein ACKER6_01340 [Candidatus Hodgkinia cicadicola]
MRTALTSGGLIFTDSQAFQDMLDTEAFKHRTVHISDILRIRSNVPIGPFNDILAKIAAVVEPSSCVLALGTWHHRITSALNGLRTNAIPAASTIISPLFPPSEGTLTSWLNAVVASPAPSACVVQPPMGGLDVVSIMFGVLFYRTSQASVLLLAAPAAPVGIQTSNVKAPVPQLAAPAAPVNTNASVSVPAVSSDVELTTAAPAVDVSSPTGGEEDHADDATIILPSDNGTDEGGPDINVDEPFADVDDDDDQIRNDVGTSV